MSKEEGWALDRGEFLEAFQIPGYEGTIRVWGSREVCPGIYKQGRRQGLEVKTSVWKGSQSPGCVGTS